MSTSRVLLLVLGVSLTACCFAGGSEPFAPPAPPPSVPPPSPAPEPAGLALSSEPTGHHSGDASLTLDRCIMTAWSYHGCEQAFPTQGRQWIAQACADAADDFERAIVCSRWAEYRIRGVGGPVERDAGIAAMTTLCQEEGRGHHVVCGTLAELMMWRDLEGARPFIERGCSSPDDSPVGTCEQLRAAQAGRISQHTVTLVEASGIAGLEAGATCDAFVFRALTAAEGATWFSPAGDCRARVECGSLVLYGDGGSSCPCTVRRDDVRAGEDMTTATDGDPAFSLDTSEGTFSLRDDAEGTHGAFALRGTVE
jgi:hypothetical protein